MYLQEVFSPVEHNEALTLLFLTIKNGASRVHGDDKDQGRCKLLDTLVLLEGALDRSGLRHREALHSPFRHYLRFSVRESARHSGVCP